MRLIRVIGFDPSAVWHTLQYKKCSTKNPCMHFNNESFEVQMTADASTTISDQ